MASLLTLENLVIRYASRDGIFGQRASFFEAVSGVSLSLNESEILAIVGESGCGKSTLASALVGLVPIYSGDFFFGAVKQDYKISKTWKFLRENIQMIFQDPYSSLNPRHSIKEILTFPLLYQKVSAADALKKAKSVLERVGLPEGSLEKYPHEFSGGQRQRIGIARALMLSPKVLICDEVTSALDVSIQAQILKLVDSLREELNISVLFISHDMQVVQMLADRVAVMYAGKFVEEGNAREVLKNPIHPYTRALIKSVPTLDFETPPEFLENELSRVSTGCAFAARCPIAKESCFRVPPKIQNIADRKIRCDL